MVAKQIGQDLVALCQQLFLSFFLFELDCWLVSWLVGWLVVLLQKYDCLTAKDLHTVQCKVMSMWCFNWRCYLLMIRSRRKDRVTALVTLLVGQPVCLSTIRSVAAYDQPAACRECVTSCVSCPHTLVMFIVMFMPN